MLRRTLQGSIILLGKFRLPKQIRHFWVFRPAGVHKKHLIYSTLLIAAFKVQTVKHKHQTTLPLRP